MGLSLGDLGAGLNAQNTCSLAAFMTPQHTEDVGFAGPATCCSLVQYFGFLVTLVPLLEVTSLFFRHRKFPHLLPFTLRFYLRAGPLSLLPAFFFSFSIVSRSLCSSLSNNRLFIFTLSRTLINCFGCSSANTQYVSVALFLPFVCGCVGIVS